MGSFRGTPQPSGSTSQATIGACVCSMISGTKTLTINAGQRLPEASSMERACILVVAHRFSLHRRVSPGIRGARCRLRRSEYSPKGRGPHVLLRLSCGRMLYLSSAYPLYRCADRFLVLKREALTENMELTALKKGVIGERSSMKAFRRPSGRSQEILRRCPMTAPFEVLESMVDRHLNAKASQ